MVTPPRNLGLAEILENRIDEFESLVNFLANFSTGENDLARHEDEHCKSLVKFAKGEQPLYIQTIFGFIIR